MGTAVDKTMNLKRQEYYELNDIYDFPIQDSPRGLNCHYYGQFFNACEASRIKRSILSEVAFRIDPEIVMYGKKYKLPRLCCAYGDEDVISSISPNSARQGELEDEYCGHTWTKTLAKVKSEVERHTNLTFNLCVINYYRNGDDHIGYHKDKNDHLISGSTIASLSFGADRKFGLKYAPPPQTLKGGADYIDSIIHHVRLRHGCLLLMNYPTNTFWKHGVPTEKGITRDRLNLTFRQVEYD
jgi:hypothetical protein